MKARTDFDKKVIEDYCNWLGVEYEEIAPNTIKVSFKGYYIIIYPTKNMYQDSDTNKKGKYIYVKELIRKKFNKYL